LFIIVLLSGYWGYSIKLFHNCLSAVSVQSKEICFESNHRFEVISASHFGAEEDELSDYQHKPWHKNNQSSGEDPALSHQRETKENGRTSTMHN